MTQKQEILAYLKKGHELSSRSASRLLYCDRLAARIFDLRADGYPISSRTVTRRSKRTGRRAAYCLYKLEVS